ncbi:MAG: hypothetical protein EBS06_00010 [Proteobacteria bacterium]|nr:hypothetical protein [Pseudomonadota bacterium]
MILSMLAAKMIGILVGSESHEKKEEVEYYITAKDGVIGCLSKEKFLEEEGYYKSGNFKEAQRLLDDEECFYFKKGDKLFAAVGTCDKSHKDDEIFPFKPNEFMMLQPYLPCASVR